MSNVESYNAPLIVVGGGPAGLIAARAAKQNGYENVIIIDREEDAGGILNQCIHAGFGVAVFNEELTGPEFADRVYNMARDENIEIRQNTTVLKIDNDRTVTTISPNRGIEKLKAAAVVLCTGCRERARGVIHIPGERPAGVYCAGLAQKFVNIDGYLPGKNFVILGSGDIGLIMARRLTLQGAKVQAVIEAQSFVGGLARNVVQCLHDYDIPLHLSHTVTDIVGTERVEKVKVAKVDEKFAPIEGSEFEIECDTLLLSIGLIPENELAESAGVVLNPVTNGAIVDENYMTSVEGIFACGNALHVHDLVDMLAVESEIVGKNAASYARGQKPGTSEIKITHDEHFGYVLPHKVSGNEKVKFHFRVRRPMENVRVHAGEYSRKIKFLQPNEMASVSVDPKYFKDEKELRLWIDAN